MDGTKNKVVKLTFKEVLERIAEYPKFEPNSEFWYVSNKTQLKELIETLGKFKAVIVGVKDLTTTTINFQRILKEYNDRICKLREKDGVFRLTANQKAKIIARSKAFTEDELVKSIENFSNDEWWKDHCSANGLSWFFYSDDRTERFLNLSTRAKKVEKVDVAVLRLQQIIAQKKNDGEQTNN